MIDIDEIRKILPHDYPFLLVDRVIEFEKGKHIAAIKNLTYNEPFFQGHFPSHPVFPGVLLIEALAQAGGLLALRSIDEKPDILSNTLIYFMGVDRFRFRNPAIPGDSIRLEADTLRRHGDVWKLAVKATVNDKRIGEGVILAKLVIDA